MSPRMLRNLLMMTAECERKIRAAGRTVPPREYLMSALAPHAKIVTRAARAAAKADRLAARARVLARECAESAVQMTEAIADSCIEAMPAQPAFTGFDPARHVVVLGAPAAGLPAEHRLTAAELS